MELLAGYGSSTSSGGGGGDGPLYWIVAVIVALAVIALATWLVRRGRARTSMTGGAMSTGPTSSATGGTIAQTGARPADTGTTDQESRPEYPETGTG